MNQCCQNQNNLVVHEDNHFSRYMYKYCKVCGTMLRFYKELNCSPQESLKFVAEYNTQLCCFKPNNIVVNEKIDISSNVVRVYRVCKTCGYVFSRGCREKTIDELSSTWSQMNSMGKKDAIVNKAATVAMCVAAIPQTIVMATVLTPIAIFNKFIKKSK